MANIYYDHLFKESSGIHFVPEQLLCVDNVNLIVMDDRHHYIRIAGGQHSPMRFPTIAVASIVHHDQFIVFAVDGRIYKSYDGAHWELLDLYDGNYEIDFEHYVRLWGRNFFVSIDKFSESPNSVDFFGHTTRAFATGDKNFISKNNPHGHRYYCVDRNNNITNIYNSISRVTKCARQFEYKGKIYVTLPEENIMINGNTTTEFKITRKSISGKMQPTPQHEIETFLSSGDSEYMYMVDNLWDVYVGDGSSEMVKMTNYKFPSFVPTERFISGDAMYAVILGSPRALVRIDMREFVVLG